MRRRLIAVLPLFRLGSDDGIDGGAGGLVTVGPDVAVDVERGFRAGVGRRAWTVLTSAPEAMRRLAAVGRDSGSPQGGPEPSCGLSPWPALPPMVIAGGRPRRSGEFRGGRTLSRLSCHRNADMRDRMRYPSVRHSLRGRPSPAWYSSRRS